MFSVFTRIYLGSALSVASELGAASSVRVAQVTECLQTEWFGFGVWCMYYRGLCFSALVQPMW